MILLHTVLLASLAAHPPLTPFQEAEVAQRTGGSVIEYFRPETAPPHELTDVMKRLFTPAGGPPMDVSFLYFGESVLVRADAETAKRALEVMQRLDREWGGERAAPEPLETLEYRARHVPVDSLHNALQPFSHPIQWTGSNGQTYQQTNISRIDDRGLLLIRGPRSELNEISALLKNVDQPQPQIRVVCYLLEGSLEATGDARVPKELAEDLAAIVPYEGFQLLTFGLFQTDALAQIQMTESLPDGGDFGLELYPKTFEASSGAITFQRCRFNLRRPTPGSNLAQTFTTSARVALDEYVVLGALGSDPVFVVLRLSLIEG